MKNRFNHLYAIVLLVAAALSGCLMGGGGSDTEISKAEVTGKLQTLDGQPAMNTQVRLVPVKFKPVAEKLSDAYSTETDHEGRYRFQKIDTGLYNLTALQVSSGTRFAAMGIKVNTTMALQNNILTTPGSISIRLPDSLSKMAGTLYMPGLLGSWQSQVGDERVLLDTLPIGRLPEIHFLTNTNPTLDIILSDSIQVLAGATSWAGPYHLWKYSAYFAINTTATGGKSDQTVYNFPLLLRLDSSDLDFSQVANHGLDFRISKLNGDPLPLLIESFDPIRRTSRVWVGMDTILENQDNQTIQLHWGYSGASMPSKPSTPSNYKSVFDTGFGYVGDWHLNLGAMGPAGIIDASEKGNHGTWEGLESAIKVEDGVIGSGIRLNGLNEKIILPNRFSPPQIFTLSLWFKSKSKVGGKLLDFSDPNDLDSSYRDFDRQIWMDSSGHVHFGIYQGWGDPMTPVPETKILSSLKNYNDDQWHWVGASLTKRGQELFIDGQLIGADSTVRQAALFNGSWTLGYGSLEQWAPFTASNYFDGVLDEVQILHRDPGPGWLPMTYLSQQLGSSLIRTVR